MDWHFGKKNRASSERTASDGPVGVAVRGVFGSGTVEALDNRFVVDG
jgi:hypothetical protein